MSLDIRAAVTHGHPATHSIETVQLGDPRDDELLVRVVATGVCHTDMKVCAEGSSVPRPIVLGHEGAGVVEKVGAAVRRFEPGDHVVMSFDFCGACPTCQAGAPAYCLEQRVRNFGGTRADGSTPLSRNGEPLHGMFFGQSSFATRSICTERNAVKVPRDLPLEYMGPFGCGFQTGAGAVINSLGVAPGHSIAVFGAGAVGLSAVMAAHLVGAGCVIAVDRVPARLALATELGATHVVDASAEDARKAILRITGRGVDRALDTTSSMKVIRQGVDSLARRGVCGIIASSATEREVPIDVLHLMGGGRRVQGIIEGDSVPATLIPLLIQMWRQGRFPVEKLVRFYPFAELAQAMRDSEEGRVVKPIVRMD